MDLKCNECSCNGGSSLNGSCIGGSCIAQYPAAAHADTVICDMLHRHMCSMWAWRSHVLASCLPFSLHLVLKQM